MTACALLALVAAALLGSAAPAVAESFEVEVVSGSTVSRVSGDAGGVVREVVTRADPSPPPVEPAEEEAEAREPRVVVVQAPPPPAPAAGLVVHSAFGAAKHGRPGPRMRRAAPDGRVGFPSPGSSGRGGRLTRGTPR